MRSPASKRFSNIANQYYNLITYFLLIPFYLIQEKSKVTIFFLLYANFKFPIYLYCKHKKNLFIFLTALKLKEYFNNDLKSHLFDEL